MSKGRQTKKWFDLVSEQMAARLKPAMKRVKYSRYKKTDLGLVLPADIYQ